jgi:hypothetical protein
MKISRENWKMIAGAAVIGVAGLLMFNQIFDYVAGILRILSLIISTLLIAWLVATVLRKLSAKPKASPKHDLDAEVETPENS